ncbi:hypothetical protein K491DRAFT_369323 [Lophiostoma macrostomum CBS 122681]|uniref:Uncharacterized protein n=1 Tax=Lophiostoma macrostomum CBS 122681 TaxID=1314788 RepID=A0A6A6TA02_9PLEO|nr:hypothetical protein K491DRAFT_369323 [Lophiostoma macrostomum CBS 122681]
MKTANTKKRGISVVHGEQACTKCDQAASVRCIFCPDGCLSLHDEKDAGPYPIRFLIIPSTSEICEECSKRYHPWKWHNLAGSDEAKLAVVRSKIDGLRPKGKDAFLCAATDYKYWGEPWFSKVGSRIYDTMSAGYGYTRCPPVRTQGQICLKCNGGWRNANSSGEKIFVSENGLPYRPCFLKNEKVKLCSPLRSKGFKPSPECDNLAKDWTMPCADCIAYYWPDKKYAEYFNDKDRYRHSVWRSYDS